MSKSVSIRLTKQGDKSSHSFLTLDPSNNYSALIGRTRGKLVSDGESFFNHKGVSRNHGALSYKDGKLFFTDKNSRNGTSVILDNNAFTLVPNQPFELGSPNDSETPDYSSVCVLHFAPNLSDASALKIDVEALLEDIASSEGTKNGDSESLVANDIQAIAGSSPSSFNHSEASSVAQRSSSVSVFDEKDDEIYDQTFVEHSKLYSKNTNPSSEADDEDEIETQLESVGTSVQVVQTDDEGPFVETIITEITETINENGQIEEKEECLVVVVDNGDDLNDDENYQGNANKDDEYSIVIDNTSAAAEEIDVANNYDAVIPETTEDDKDTAKPESKSLFNFLSSLAPSRKRKRDAEDDGEDLRQGNEPLLDTAAETLDSVEDTDSKEAEEPLEPPANPNKRTRVAEYLWAFSSGAVVGAVGIFGWLVATAPES